MLDLLAQETVSQPLDEIRDWWQQIEQWRGRQCLKYDTQSEQIKPQAVIEAAGGVMTDWRGGPAHRGGRIIAAGDPRLHAAALNLLADVPD